MTFWKIFCNDPEPFNIEFPEQNIFLLHNTKYITLQFA
jgi:hypothetical protein